MNFVIFSMGFLPFKGAESWCTSRFAGALSHCGHDVHVVTIDHDGDVPSDVWNLIVGSRVKVTRVKTHIVHKPIFARARYLTYEWDAVDYGACIEAVRVALRESSDAVLITRSNPLASTIVGWHCRAFAKKWVAHLSDPIPIPGREENWRCLHGHVNRFWMRRVLRDADIVSVTCPNAIRAFEDEYGELARRTRFVVTPHVGEPSLSASVGNNSVNEDVVRIVHHGVMCGGRGAPELAAAVRQLNRNGRKCEFIQCGQVDDVAEVFESDSCVYRADNGVADVEYIPDLEVPLSYCPFLSSKFVYRVFDDTPILLRTRKDSFSAQLAWANPNSGIVVATEKDDLAMKLREAIDLVGGPVDRSGLRECFSRSRIVDDFVKNIRAADHMAWR